MTRRALPAVRSYHPARYPFASIADDFYPSFEQVRHAYERFAGEVAEWLYGPGVPFHYQHTPTYRESPPGGLAVAEWHTDDRYGHQAGEVNVWVPLTRAWGANTIQLEGWRTREMGVGSYLVFDAITTRHGSVVNTTEHRRRSFDFRLIAHEDYKPNAARSVVTGKVLAPGDYFTELADP